MEQQVRHFLEAGSRGEVFNGVPGDGKPSRFSFDVAEPGGCGDDAIQAFFHDVDLE